MENVEICFTWFIVLYIARTRQKYAVHMFVDISERAKPFAYVFSHNFFFLVARLSRAFGYLCNEM